MTSRSDNMTSHGHGADTIAGLPYHFTVLLSQLALLGELSRTALLENVHLLGISPTGDRRMSTAEVSDALERLRAQGWVQKTGTRWALTPGLENSVFLWLLTQPEARKAILGGPQPLPLYLRGVTQPDRALLWTAILSGNVTVLPALLAKNAAYFDYFDAVDPTVTLFTDDAGQRVFTLLNEEVQSLLLATALNDASYRLSDCQPIWQFARAQALSHKRIAELLHGPLALQALLRNDRELLTHLTANGLPLSVAGWFCLYRGDPAGATEVHRQLLGQYRKITRSRQLHLPPLASVRVALTLLPSDKPADIKTLREVTRQAVAGGFGGEWSILEGLLRERSGAALAHPPQMSSRAFSGMAGLLKALVLYWRGDIPDADKLCKQLEAFARLLEARGYQLPAYDIRTILHLTFSQAAPTRPGEVQPLCSLWQRKPDWEYALEALGQLMPKASSSDSRLAWLVALGRWGVELSPLEQKRNKQGWTKGRAVALKRLHAEADTLPWLVAQDRQVIRHIHYTSGYSYYDRGRYELDAESALPLLAGHPAVFWHDAPDTRIDVEAGQVTLVLTESDNRLRLTLSPAIGEGQHLVTRKETPTRLVVYPVSEEHRRIAAIVGDGLHIPLSGRDRALQSVAAIAPLLPVQTDLPELMAHIPHVPADEKIYAHLLPLGEGLRMQLLVRPLADGAWFAPGRGSDVISGEQAGQAIQAQRSLADEQQRLRQVLALCPMLAEGAPDTNEWQFDDPQDALEALSELRNVDSALLECVWPEGERLRLGGRRNMHALTLNTHRQGEWFTLSGTLKLDDGRVLELRQLLTLLQESRGRFIRLGEGDWLALDNQLRQRLQQIALLSGGRDNLNLNALTLPFLKQLADEAGEFSGDADWQQQLSRLEAREQHRPAVPSTLKAELRDYQVDGFCWLSRLAQWGVGACLADDMGLGKTLQALALMLERASGGAQLVVAPTSVTHNWLSESSRFAPTLRLRDYRSRRDLSALEPFEVVVVSYGLLLQDAGLFHQPQWHSVVLDEAQSIKNAQTQRAKAVTALKADFRLALSGTPVENHLGELWSLFRFLNPGLLGSLKSFNQRFALPAGQGDRVAGGALKQLVKPFILRRTKSQVLDELPPRTDILYQIPMSAEEQHWYEALRRQAVENLEAGENVGPLQVLTEITRLRRLCCNPALVLESAAPQSSKLAACLAIIGELRENHHKALVFSQFVDHLALLRAALERAGIAYQYLDGTTPAAERQKRVAAFQAGEGDLFLISLKAGGTGLNLTAADYVIHLDPWWNPAVEDQASDRAHRMGQERPVTVYRLVMEGTLEEQMVSLHNKKRQMAEDLLEGSDAVGRLDTQALLSVLRGGTP
ncbi:DEAD/DEAH box helicase [Pluralibacter gergoviae]|uniref:DEAD/DEAH box helicase n=1 Tax=Pluralibacter gergoviae TaxID=61647 RepID=UPI0029159C42|nr:DEAD/DEAH box helicase [Pluralibacter gergoviae]MDU4001566.1 DEAD/DEAH box helicase [Pluralibacter gergoviae]